MDFALTGEAAEHRPTRRQSPSRALLAALVANQTILREVGLQYGVAEAPGAPAGATVVRTDTDVANVCADMYALRQEQLRVLLLDTKQQLVDVVTVYQGTVNSADIRAAEVLRPAVLANVPGIIVVHNHPTGDPTPSPEDIRVTRRLRAAAELLSIDLQDHVVLAEHGAVSMRRRCLGFDS